jgi:hypothetical protein
MQNRFSVVFHEPRRRGYVAVIGGLLEQDINFGLAVLLHPLS